MKKLLLIVTFLLVILPVNFAVAQTFVPPDSDNRTVGFAGPRYSEGMKLTIGVGQNISDNVWWVPSFNIGRNGAELGLDFAYLRNLEGTNAAIGFTAGPGANWMDVEGQTPVSYLYGAAGLMGTYRFTPTFGLALWYQYKDDFVNDDNLLTGRHDGGLVFWWDW